MNGLDFRMEPSGLTTFVDAEGCSCSMNDSSLASDSAIWMGVDRIKGAKHTVRMHLTRGMALGIAREVRDHAEGRSTEGRVDTFVDRSGSQCAVECVGATLLVGVILGFERHVGTPMTLTREMCRDLLPFLIGFVQNGHLTVGDDLSVLDEPAVAAIDGTVPPAALDATGIGDTGVSVGDLIDAFLRLYRYVELDDAVGRDEATRIEAMSEGLASLKRNGSSRPR